MDSGVAYHVTLKNDFFATYTLGDFRMLKIGNDGQIKVLGVGIVCLETNFVTKLVLNNVKHKYSS